MSGKAVVYARVSTDHEEQKSSLKSQREYYSEYANEKGFELLKVYFDEGLSATSPKREHFLQMLYDAGLDFSVKMHSGMLEFDTSNREPKFNWIILKDVSRFARNTDAGSIAKYLREKEVYIEFENMGFTTKDDDWEFRFNLFLTFAQQESIDKSQKLRKAYDIRSAKGIFHMSNILLGYQRNAETDEYEVCEDEAKIVRYIFDLYVDEGIGTTEISDRINSLGCRTKQGKRFNGNSVLRMLKHEKFKGVVILNRYTHTSITGSHKRFQKPKDEWIIYPDAIPKIVPIEKFDKAQKIMHNRAVHTKQFGKKGVKVPKSEYYKKVFCGKCGADYVRLTTSKTRGGEKVTEYFYGCRNRRNTSRLEEKCTNRGIAHNVLVREITKIGKKLNPKFNQIRIHEEKEALDRILKNLDKKINNSKADKGEIREKIEGLDKQLSNITSSIAGGVSESVRKVMFAKVDEIEQEKTKLEASTLEHDTIKIENNKQEYIGKFEEIVKFSKKKEYSYDEVISIISRIDVLPSRDVIVELETPTLVTDDEVYKGETSYALFPFTFKLR